MPSVHQSPYLSIHSQKFGLGTWLSVFLRACFSPTPCHHPRRSLHSHGWPSGTLTSLVFDFLIFHEFFFDFIIPSNVTVMLWAFAIMRSSPSVNYCLPSFQPSQPPNIIIVRSLSKIGFNSLFLEEGTVHGYITRHMLLIKRQTKSYII